MAVVLLGTARLAATPAQGQPAETVSATLSPETVNTFVAEYCVMCHSDAAETGGLTLEHFDASHLPRNAEVAEKMIRKLRLGMMPPAIAPQPEAETSHAVVTLLETTIDIAAARNPYPGRRPLQRLNRAEYTRAIRELFGIDVDVTAFLPPDTSSDGFDNIADVQTMSATLMEGYLRAANTIGRLAVGNPSASPTEVTYKVSRRASQMERVEGAPLGTRGGVSVVHVFPADGEYIFKVQLHSTPTGYLYGLTAGDGEQIEISINGERVALLDIDPLMHEEEPTGMVRTTEPISVKSGPQRVTAAFIQRFAGPVDDLMAPIAHTLADTTIGRAHGVTTAPHLRFFSITGPHRVTGVSDSPSRRRIFVCRPTSPDEELPCARRILSRLATQAYRRPVSESDVEGLMSFYQSGRDEGDFESGIRTSVQAILASPQFLFRLERNRSRDSAGPDAIFRLSDVELASRLSFFLWSTGPDEELLTLAADGALSDPDTLAAQVSRMLDDPRSEALATRFASQWLRLQDLERLHPDYQLYPNYDDRLSKALERETEVFFENLIREDRSALEILTADYTFANERVAEHYRIPNVIGERFRRVSYPNENRRGILGHGSVLTLTSVADRTSPVLRGKWVMEVLLGSPPPPPPPNVPDLEATQDTAEGRVLSVREALEAHRANPACNSCHRVIDPLGLALENFDVTGAWRIKDHGVPVDPSGELYDGTPIDGPEGLRKALMKRWDSVIRTFTENLLTYALGRRLEHYDMPTVRAIVREAKDNDYRMSSLILGVVESAPFQMTAAEEGPSTSTEAQ